MFKSKRLWRSLFSLLLAVCLINGMVFFPHAAEQPTLTIASYNIAGNKAIPSNLLAGDIKAKNVDVVGLQEVDRLSGRNNHDVPVEIATELGAEYNYFFGKCIDLDGGGEYGNAIISRHAFKETDYSKFAENGYERRCWVKTVIEVGGKSVAIYNTHLCWETIKARHEQVMELLKVVDADPTPYKVITGDFNADQFHSEFYPFLYNYNLANGHNNEWLDTYAEEDSSMRTNAIDNIITTRNMKLVNVDTYYREEGSRSDHKMLYATYQLLDEEVPSTQLLDLRIQEAQDLLKQDGYTPESLAALKTALKQAVEGKKNTQNQINALVRPLEQAIDGMVKAVTPVAYYNFDDGTTHDLIANSHGTDKGNTAYVESFSPQAGKALDTTNGYVSIPKVNDAFRWGTRDASIAFWFKSSDYKNEGWILGDKDFNSGANPGFGVCYYYNRVYSSFAELGNHRTEQQNPDTLNYIKDGKWHHIVATLDRDGQSLFYVDGVQVADAVTNLQSTGNATTDLPFCIGADVNGKYGIAAQFDELKIYDTVLTPAQVRQAAELPHVHKSTLVEAKAPTCTEAGNIAYWHCAECDKYFKDESCKEEIALEDTVIAATGHKYENGTCTVCGAEDPNYVDKTQLKQTVAKAEGLDLTGYTAESVESFKTALEAAQTVLADETLTRKDQAAVDAATEKLVAAIDGLTAEPTPDPDPEPNPEPEKPDPDVKPEPTPAPDAKPEPPKTGDNSSVMMWATVAMASLAGVACAAVALMNSRKRRSI